MFNQKDEKQKKEEEKGSNLKETDFPIHHLKKDLQELKKNPNYNPSNFTKEQIAENQQENKKRLNEKQKTSPFLNEPTSDFAEKPQQIQKKETLSDPKENIEREKPEKVEIKKVHPQIQKETPKKIVQRNEDTQKIGKKLFFSVAIIVIIISAAALSFYYYNTNLKKEAEKIVTQTEIEETTPPENESTKEENEESSETKEEFSQENPNFLILDENIEAKNIIKKYAQKVFSQNSSLPIEFIPVNNSYEPLTLENFLKSLNINLYPEILSKIDKEKGVSLYLYKDIEGPRLGLVIPIIETVSISKEIENQLAKDFEPLLLDEVKEENFLTYEKNSYKNTPINYINFKKGGSLSLDYFILNKNLIFATSKNISFAIIDKLLSPSV